MSWKYNQIILKRFIIKSYGWQLFKLSGNYSSKTKFHFFQNYNFTSYKGTTVFLQVSYENRNRSLFLLVTFLKMKVSYKWDKKENVLLVIWVEFYWYRVLWLWLAYWHCFVIDAKIWRVTQGLCYGFPLTPLTLTYSLLLGTKHCSGRNVSCTRGWQAESRGKKI